MLTPLRVHAPFCQKHAALLQAHRFAYHRSTPLIHSLKPVADAHAALLPHAAPLLNASSCHKHTLLFAGIRTLALPMPTPLHVPNPFSKTCRFATSTPRPDCVSPFDPWIHSLKPVAGAHTGLLPHATPTNATPPLKVLLFLWKFDVAGSAERKGKAKAGHPRSGDMLGT